MSSLIIAGLVLYLFINCRILDSIFCLDQELSKLTSTLNWLRLASSRLMLKNSKGHFGHSPLYTKLWSTHCSFFFNYFLLLPITVSVGENQTDPQSPLDSASSESGLNTPCLCSTGGKKGLETFLGMVIQQKPILEMEKSFISLCDYLCCCFTTNIILLIKILCTLLSEDHISPLYKGDLLLFLFILFV